MLNFGKCLGYATKITPKNKKKKQTNKKNYAKSSRTNSLSVYVQDARKSNFTAKRLNTFVAHCSLVRLISPYSCAIQVKFAS